jgi:formylglycine-generating enzyme required for sulfatase activity
MVFATVSSGSTMDVHLARPRRNRPRHADDSLSYFEADAYARWAGARLPIEFEWEAAAADGAIDGNFQHSGALDPLAPRIDPAHGNPSQLFGDVWEWT